MTTSPSSPLPLWQLATIVVSIVALIVTVVGTALAFLALLDSRLTSATDQADSHIENIRREDAEQLRAINTRLDAIQTVMLQHYSSPSITSG